MQMMDIHVGVNSFVLKWIVVTKLCIIFKLVTIDRLCYTKLLSIFPSEFGNIVTKNLYERIT